METDREAPGGDERAGTPESPSTSGASPSHSPAGDDSRGESPDRADPSREYGYGETPLDAAGDTGLRAADSGAQVPEGGTAEATDPATDADPATGIHPATGLRGATTPRAVLRPIPEGFPTPPPRPAGPNRRPTPKSEESPTPRPRRGLLLTGISVAVVLLLVVGIGGGILAYRALTSPDQGSQGSDAPASEQAGGAGTPGQVQMGEVTITEVSTEIGVREVGTRKDAVSPEGEFLIVTFEVTNGSSRGISLGQNVTLETADGTTHAPDQAAGNAYVAESSAYGVVEAGGTMTQHRVYDVPIGSEPSSLTFAPEALEESGTLPLGG